MSVVSLERLALHKIARDIKLWCQDVTDSDFNRYLYVLGPFDCFGERTVSFIELSRVLAFLSVVTLLLGIKNLSAKRIAERMFSSRDHIRVPEGDPCK